MDKLAEKLTRYVLVQGVIEEEDYAIYKYGFQTGIELLLCVVTSIIIAIYMGKCCECFLLMVSFFSLRGSMDGIHMKHFSSCYLLSSAVLIGGLKFSEIVIVSNIVMLVLVLIVLIGMYGLSTCDTVMTKKDETERYFSKQRKKVLVFVGGMAVVFLVCNYSVGLNIVFYSEVITVVSTLAKTACKQVACRRGI